MLGKKEKNGKNNDAFVRYLCDQTRRLAPKLNEEIEKLLTPGGSKYPDGLPIALVFEIHNSGIPVFEVMDQPYISYQFVGNFAKPEEIDKLKGKYDFQHDDRGAFEYAYRCNPDHVMSMLISSLSYDGVFFSKKLKLETVKKGATGASFDGADLKLPEGSLLLTGKDTNYKEELEGIIFREGSIISEVLSETVKHHPREGQVIKVKNLDGLLKERLS